MPWKKLSGERPTERRWTIDEFLVAGKLNTLFGKGGLGKSFIVASMAVCIAAGVPWLGRKTEHGLVYWLDYETDEDEFSRIVVRVSAGLGVLPPLAAIRYLEPTLPLPSLLDQLRKDLEVDRPALVVDDSVGASLFGMRTQSEDEITAFLTRLRGTGWTWMLIDHVAKTGKSKTPFGSGYKEYLSRNAWFIGQATTRANSIAVTLKRTKSSYRTATADLRLVLDFEGEPDVGPIRISEVAAGEEKNRLTTVEAQIRTYLPADEEKAVSARQLAERCGREVRNIQNILTSLKHKGWAMSRPCEGRPYDLWWAVTTKLEVA